MKTPDAVPEIGFGDILKYGQIIAPLVALIKQIESGGPVQGNLPELKTHLGSKRLILGPTPYRVE